MDASQRCNAKSCNAQAYWITWINGSDIEWCNHHFGLFEVKLRAVAEWVIDDRPEWMTT